MQLKKVEILKVVDVPRGQHPSVHFRAPEHVVRAIKSKWPQATYEERKDRRVICLCTDRPGATIEGVEAYLREWQYPEATGPKATVFRVVPGQIWFSDTPEARELFMKYGNVISSREIPGLAHGLLLDSNSQDKVIAALLDLGKDKPARILKVYPSIDVIYFVAPEDVRVAISKYAQDIMDMTWKDGTPCTRMELHPGLIKTLVVNELEKLIAQANGETVEQLKTSNLTLIKTDHADDTHMIYVDGDYSAATQLAYRYNAGIRKSVNSDTAGKALITTKSANIFSSILTELGEPQKPAKPQPVRKLEIIEEKPSERYIVFETSPEIASQIKEFGRLNHYGGTPIYYLTVSRLYDYDAVLKYIKSLA